METAQSILHLPLTVFGIVAVLTIVITGLINLVNIVKQIESETAE